MSELKYKEITEKIIGVAMKVHAASGSGCLNHDLGGF
jgi:hypothetical protein